MSGVIGILATSTQAVRAAEHGDGFDSRQGQVKMAFSGSMVPTAIDVQPDTITDEELLAGNGTLGPFTFRKLRTDETSPQFFGSCGSGFGPSHSSRRRRGRLSLRRRKSLDGHRDGGSSLRGCRPSGGPPYRDVSDHRWNRAIQGCVRHPSVNGDIEAGVVQRRERGRTLDEYGGVEGNSSSAIGRKERRNQWHSEEACWHSRGSRFGKSTRSRPATPTDPEHRLHVKGQESGLAFWPLQRSPASPSIGRQASSDTLLGDAGDRAGRDSCRASRPSWWIGSRRRGFSGVHANSLGLFSRMLKK